VSTHVMAAGAQLRKVEGGREGMSVVVAPGSRDEWAGNLASK